MVDLPFENTYDLTAAQLITLGEAEDAMEMGRLNAAEKLLESMVEEDANCIPALATLGHLNGRYLSDYESAISYYERVLKLEPDNAWARDERRRYMRWVSRG